ncbi:hypothetical protein [Erythrobacter dokdonensis]|uniref:Uncharacterized protein n=1 Tax=Erythrobacter dokdonensis DSW-74 TaxID=1300349 RepID=A0A1A7BI19_9SPHN|nr:hypothetical protein [Erythrobacter dokdonensis]MEE4315485.1 hypothetical protein [Erythrobacter sp.]OBV10845.1 hypothetical protein I603_2058 [Erythrobacter dokdonensis DSW-74]
MAHRADSTAKAQRKLPLLAACGLLALALPSAGLALVGKTMPSAGPSFESMGLNVFTPASVDPELAARVAEKARARGIRFTPAGATSAAGERTVTVAVRVDSEEARAISVRKAIDAVPGRGVGLSGLETSRFQLGSARGYKSFTRPVELPAEVRRMALPDLAQFEPSRPKSEDKPSRLQPRIELEDREIAGRSPNTLDSIASQTVGVGGSFRLSPNLNVTAGVRYSQERERLDPLTNSVQDSQAVYVGTQIKF